MGGWGKSCRGADAFSVFLSGNLAEEAKNVGFLPRHFQVGQAFRTLQKLHTLKKNFHTKANHCQALQEREGRKCCQQGHSSLMLELARSQPIFEKPLAPWLCFGEPVGTCPALSWVIRQAVGVFGPAAWFFLSLFFLPVSLFSSCSIFIFHFQVQRNSFVTAVRRCTKFYAIVFATFRVTLWIRRSSTVSFRSHRSRSLASCCSRTRLFYSVSCGCPPPSFLPCLANSSFLIRFLWSSTTALALLSLSPF